jgi:hypothetical protein
VVDLKYQLKNGKTVNIPDKELEKSMKALELTKEEAIQMWLEDNDYEVNEEQVALDEKAKKVKINHGASAIDKTEQKEKKPRVVKISDEKQALFNEILTNLQEIYPNSVEIVKENKLLTVKIGGKTFKVDLIEQRPPKNK